MFRAFIPDKLADRMVAQRSFLKSAACLIQFDITNDLKECFSGTFSDQGAEMRNAVAKMSGGFA